MVDVSTVIEPDVWATVRGRGGPARWVVVAALVLGAAVVAAAWSAVSRGLTAPQLITDGWSSNWDAATTTGRTILRLGNTSEHDVRVVSARLVQLDGTPLPYAQVVAFTPTDLPGRPDAGASWDVPMKVEVDCDAARTVGPEAAGTLILTTSGTWPTHEQILTSDFDVAMWCSETEG